MLCADLLSTDNMREVFDLAWDYRSRWKFIGIELNIDPGTLDAIDKDNKNAEDCLCEMLIKWLCGSNPSPTRSALTIALRSRLVAGETASTQGMYTYKYKLR